MPTLYENYTTGDDADSAVWGTRWRAQTLTPAIGHTITSVKLKLRRVGSPGTMTASIRNTDVNGKPTGSDLVSGTTNADTLPVWPAAHEWREITFGAGTSLSASAKYAIVVRCPSGDIDLGLYARWGIDTTSPTYAGGIQLNSNDSGSSWDDTLYDALFEDWGDPGIPTVTTQACTDVKSITATGNGSITDIGLSSVTQHGHCWSINFNPATSDSNTQNGTASVGSFTSNISGLNSLTSYYTRAYAVNTYGTAYGANIDFTTLSGFIPKVFVM